MKFHERLLRVTLGRYETAALLGDLEEEAARLGAPPSWVRKQALRCAASSAWLAVRRKRIRTLTTARLAFRDARRSISRFRATSLAAVVILALSMAAGAVTFAVVDTIVLRPLPYPDSDRLVSISVKTPENARTTVARTEYDSWRTATSSFDGLAAWRTRAFDLVDGRGSEPVTLVVATSTVFDVLRVRPVIGTTFTEENETPGRDTVAVISYRLWQRRYGGDAAVLGSQLATPMGRLTIVGVMPRDFGFPIEAAPAPAIWRPFGPTAEERLIALAGGERTADINVVGRLKDGVSLEQARADVERVFGALRAARPRLYTDKQSRTERLQEMLTERVAGWMRLVLAAVAVLMAIGCVNVSNLLLTRSAQRARDVSIRLSLGATRAQVTASLMAESLLLSAAAGAAGLLAAQWLLAIVKAALPEGIVRAEIVQLDARVLAACVIAGALTALVSGLVPGWQASHVTPAHIMKDGAGATAGRGRHLFPGRSAVGQRVNPGRVTVIGIAANVRLLGPEGVRQAQMYRLMEDGDTFTFARFLLIRTSRPVATVVPAIQSALAPVLRTEPGAVKVDIVNDEFRRLTADRRFNAGVMAALGLLALLIAASGVYSTTASIVAQQTREIGIRMTLGASGGRIVRAITAATARLLVAGAALGLAAAWSVSRVLESVVFGIRPTDALVYIVPFAIVGAGGFLVAILPAMKAARIDPLVTLRTE